MDLKSGWKRGSLLGALAAFGMVFGCNRPANSVTGPAGELTLIYTTGNNGEVKDCGCPHHPLGGMARRARIVQDLKQGGKTGSETHPPRQVLQVDAGDGFFDYLNPPLLAAASDQDKAQVIARALTRMDVDAINVGSFDLAGGYDFLKQALGSKYQLPLISSNLYDKGKNAYAFRRSLVIERAGLKVGVFGLIQDLPPLRAGNLEVKDYAQATREMVNELRGKCDLVIALANLDFNLAAELAKQAPGIDVIVVSRGYRLTPQPFLAESTLVVQARTRGKEVGRMDLKMKPGGRDAAAVKERENLNRQREQLEAQRKILEGQQNQADPQFKAKYDEVVKQIADADRRLNQIRGGFENKNAMVEVELSLPEDPQIARWVADLSKPAPAAPGKP